MTENKKSTRNMPLTVSLAIAALCGLAVVVAVLTVAHPCQGVLELANGNAVPMRCTYTAKIAVLIGAVLFIVGAWGSFMQKDYAVPVALLSVCLIAITFDFFAGIGVCKAEMDCWTMAFVLRLFGAVSLVAAAAGAVLSPSRKRVGR